MTQPKVSMPNRFIRKLSDLRAFKKPVDNLHIASLSGDPRRFTNSQLEAVYKLIVALGEGDPLAVVREAETLTELAAGEREIIFYAMRFVRMSHGSDFNLKLVEDITDKYLRSLN